MPNNPFRVHVRRWLAALTLLLNAGALYAQQHHHPTATTHRRPDPPGVHGMLVFGTEQVFASHLPMFHAPHDYQVVLALGLPDSARTAYAQSRRAFPAEMVYTLEPERLVLPELVQMPRPFRATLYRGHFERGGVPIARNVVVRLQRVAYFPPLVGATPPAPQQAFLLLGNAHEQFLLHRIEGRPGFDQVLRVQAPAARARLRRHPLLLWQRPGPNPAQPLPAGPVTGTVAGRPVPLVVEQQLYLEFDDLR